MTTYNSLSSIAWKMMCEENISFGDFNCDTDRPTGLSSEPPEGPAIPEVAMAQSVCIAWHAPIAIASTTGMLTAPCFRAFQHLLRESSF